MSHIRMWKVPFLKPTDSLVSHLSDVLKVCDGRILFSCGWIAGGKENLFPPKIA